MIRRFVLLALALAVAVAPARAQESRPLAQGQTLSGTLATGSEHAFTLTLDANQFVYGAVDQLTVDAVVTIHDADGAIAQFDTPSRGEERFTFESEAAGTYVVRVAPFEEEEGDYTITIRRAEDIATDPDDRVDQMLAAFDDDETPGAVVGIIADGDVVFEKAYGMANLTWDIPFEADMRSNIGSVTKQFVAMGTLLLEQAGELSLDDEVREYIPELPDFGSPVTIRHLLNHVGGYREVYNAFGMMGYNGEDAFPREKVIQLVQRQPELQAEPNTEFNYNNTGFILVAMTIERVSGMAFEDYMRERVFEPLGMNNTLMTSHQGQVIPNSAMGYVPAEEGGYRQARDLPAAAGAGGIYTTAQDMAKWMLNYRDHSLGGAEAVDAITTNTILASGDSTGYGLGLGIGEHRGRAIWTHTGGDVAHRTYFAWYPELESGVFVSSNNAGFDLALGRPLAEAFWDDRFEPEEEPEVIAEADMSDERREAIVGFWRLEAGLGIDIELVDGELRASPEGQSTRVLVPTSDSTLSVTGVEASITFIFDADGRTNEAVLNQGGPQPMSRVTEEDEPSDPDWMKEYEGRYWSEEFEVAFTLVEEDEKLIARSFRLEDITLAKEEDDAFAAGAVGTLRFQRASNGRITGFMVDNGRTKDVWFARRGLPGG